MVVFFAKTCNASPGGIKKVPIAHAEHKAQHVAPGHVVYKLEAHLVRHLEVLAAAGGQGDVVRDVTI